MLGNGDVLFNVNVTGLKQRCEAHTVYISVVCLAALVYRDVSQD